MGKYTKVAAWALVAASLSGCVRDAHIAMPGDLRAASDRIELTGIGAGERGTFRLGASSGSFHRSSGQEAYDDGYVRNAGGLTFKAQGPELGGDLSASCGFNQSETDTGIVTVPDERFEFRCRFDRAIEPSDATLVLRAAPSKPGRLLSGITRRGEMLFNGRRISIRAIHDMEGGVMPAGTPIGYMFELDGREIGAVDTNGGAKTVYAPRSGPEREAILAASLALSILWDPGE